MASRLGRAVATVGGITLDACYLVTAAGILGWLAYTVASLVIGIANAL